MFEIYADIPNVGHLALGGGGRYNGLVKELDGPDTPAVGFALGYDRTLLAMEEAGVNIPINKEVDIYVMYVSDSEKEYVLKQAMQSTVIESLDCDYDVITS